MSDDKPLNVQKLGGLVNLTRGIIEANQRDSFFGSYMFGKSDPEEIARRKAAEEARLAEFDAQLTKAHPALNPIIELHSRNEYGSCTGCDTGAYAEDDPYWPCSTIDLILEGIN